MSEVSLKLSAKDIYEKDFEKTMTRGYRREEVNDFLDDIKADYQKMEDLDNEVVNNNATTKNNSSNNNVDILKRISNLEKAVFGK